MVAIEMCFSEFMRRLQNAGIECSEKQMLERLREMEKMGKVVNIDRLLRTFWIVLEEGAERENRGEIRSENGENWKRCECWVANPLTWGTWESVAKQTP